MANKRQESIPAGKVKRASRFLSTGIKVGGNYIKHFAKKATGENVTKESLDQANAEDIYGLLSELKGSVLKVAQMLSMEDQVLPVAYQEKFSLSQNRVPPLSGPLIRKTFVKYLSKKPSDVFDYFSPEAVYAASIGQVHKATLNDQTLAVKIQYPGVADSIQSDLKIARPLAAKLLNISLKDLDYYVKEVESKLIEETDYNQELIQGMFISEKCSHLEGIVFPEFKKELSSEKILVMSWLSGPSLKDYIEKYNGQDIIDSNSIGQALWNFYNYQVHNLKLVHADPHPGNFVITDEGKLGVLDFGCTKEIPDSFYNSFFALIDEGVLEDDRLLEKYLIELEIIRIDDSKDTKDYLISVYRNIIGMVAEPIIAGRFDFSDKKYFEKINNAGKALSKDKKLKKIGTARGSRHAIYINRTYFGLYRLLHMLKATINTNAFMEKVEM
ncbi:ABC1 kinase family protein [Marinigracilibium pacificum]|uniref:AarF/ABC1/UbiB kinase family protein n=1 Tax=Marinigracilibium pacificum TaxID=2729599 RepID=A0A848J3X8_9BACT|nr:AarF/UbiB family protein [Marinigracilibium pacificum]NMM49059.1 AarF/ABC1/UbiB kinase family protein [Marinigracilibium pacificum]